MSVESWRLSRAELRKVLDSYEKALEEDSFNLLRPTDAERKMLGYDVLKKRADAVKRARDANREFVEKIVEDLPDLCAGPDTSDIPPRPVCEFKVLNCGIGALPTNSYGSIASVNLHLLRDWSANCAHVDTSTYGPAVAELKALLPSCKGEILLPGCGLGRLALEFAKEGFKVEANDASRLFLTVADYILNRPPALSSIFPIAHVFTENWGLDQQYIEVKVPDPSPALGAAVKTDGTPASFTMVPGDFIKLYQAGGVGHRKFDAIVTCFFIDTAVDVCEQFRVMDELLEVGGIWLNIGPLNWRKEARLKLTYEEIVAVWENMGYEFVSNKRIDCDYHLPRGFKMYTESYQGALTAAIKRRASP